MTRLRALAAAFALALGVAGAAAQEIVRVPSELANAATHFPRGMTLGDPGGDVAIVEFFDYNCPYCRQANADLRKLIGEDRKVRVVLVQYAILGPSSIEAARVALAVAKLKPEAFAAFHERLFAHRGRIDGAAALAAAAPTGLARASVVTEADSAETTAALKNAARLGSSLGLSATPSYVVLTDAIVGHPGFAKLKAIAAAVRACEKTECP